MFPGCSEQAIRVERRDQTFVTSEKLKISEDGQCLKPTTYYYDGDQDGFGNPNRSVSACEPPPGHVDNHQDCADDDPRAFPGQKQFFSTPRPDGSFDFDCDGQSSVRLTVRAFCEEKPENRGCSSASGWDLKPSQRIPNCGEAADWAWNECRTELIPDEPVADMAEIENNPQAPPVISIPSPRKSVQRCWSGKLQWKKRQLCR